MYIYSGVWRLTMKKGFIHLSSRRHSTKSDLLFRRFHFYCCSGHRNFTSASSPVRYNLIEYVERLEGYKPGGYHPVHLGEKFHNRYRVVHKLGYGTYSTTWLARDQRNNKLVAVKIGTADSNPREADILSTLNARGGNKPPIWDKRDSFFPPILDRFAIRGVNGVHPCYVTSLARASLSDAKDGAYGGLFQLDVARALAAQLSLSVTSLHSQGFVHGDLHLGNILLRSLPSVQDLSDQELYDKYGSPKPEAITLTDGGELPQGVPSYAVVPLWLGEPSEEVIFQETKIWVTDMGEAFEPSLETRDYSHAPVSSRPPEFLFDSGSKVSFSSDIWTLACSIWAILSQGCLFDSFFPDPDFIMKEQIDILGRDGLPDSWWDQWEARSKYFTEASEPLPDRQVWSWEDQFEEGIQKARKDKEFLQISTAEKEAIFAMLRPMLTFKPEDRCTAAQVLESKWMTQWALPEYEKMRA